MMMTKNTMLKHPSRLWFLGLVVVLLCFSDKGLFATHRIHFAAAGAAAAATESPSPFSSSSSSSSSASSGDAIRKEMETIADQALDLLNAHHATKQHQVDHYDKALHFLGEAVEVFETKTKCGDTSDDGTLTVEYMEEHCPPALIATTISIYGQFAEVLLELAEFFYIETEDKEAAFDFAKQYIDKGLALFVIYQGGGNPEKEDTSGGQAYLQELMLRLRRLQLLAKQQQEQQEL